MENRTDPAVLSAPLQKERIFFWDNLKGILILLVVICHLIIGYGTSSRLPRASVRYFLSYLETFVMPTFVFCAGYLSKSGKARSAAAYVKLFTVYLIFNGIMSVYMYLESGTAFHLTRPSISFWYLPALILWRWSVGYVSRLRLCLPFSVLIALLAGFWSEIGNSFALGQTVCFYPFFLAGFLFEKECFTRLLGKRHRTAVGITAFALLSLSVYRLMHLHFLTSDDWQFYHYQNAWPDLLDRILLIGIAALLGTALMAAIPNKKLPFISKWGRNSLGIYVTNRLFSRLFLLAFPVSGFSRAYYAYIAAAAFLLCLVFGTDGVNRIINRIADKASEFILSVNDTPQQKSSVILPIAAVLVLMIGLLAVLF